MTAATSIGRSSISTTLRHGKRPDGDQVVDPDASWDAALTQQVLKPSSQLGRPSRYASRCCSGSSFGGFLSCEDSNAVGDPVWNEDVLHNFIDHLRM